MRTQRFSHPTTESAISKEEFEEQKSATLSLIGDRDALQIRLDVALQQIGLQAKLLQLQTDRINELRLQVEAQRTTTLTNLATAIKLHTANKVLDNYFTYGPFSEYGETIKVGIAAQGPHYQSNP